MKITDIEAYKNWEKVNEDSYGVCVFRYAERWADLMEKELENGAHIKDIAKRLSHEADTDGITGYMYGAAVSVLSSCWEYGEQLAKWHNGEYKYTGDGVANPAIINIE